MSHLREVIAYSCFLMEHLRVLICHIDGGYGIGLFRANTVADATFHTGEFCYDTLKGKSRDEKNWIIYFLAFLTWIEL